MYVCREGERERHALDSAPASFVRDSSDPSQCVVGLQKAEELLAPCTRLSAILLYYIIICYVILYYTRSYYSML